MTLLSCGPSSDDGACGCGDKYVPARDLGATITRVSLEAVMSAVDWVDELLLAGADGDVCLTMGREVTRAQLRQLVADRGEVLRAAGLRAGGTVALRVPPSLAFVTNLLAAWRIGAQASLLDYRLTPYEVDAALVRLAPQVVVAGRAPAGALRGYAEVTETVTGHPGAPAATAHAL